MGVYDGSEAMEASSTFAPSVMSEKSSIEYADPRGMTENIHFEESGRDRIGLALSFTPLVDEKGAYGLQTSSHHLQNQNQNQKNQNSSPSETARKNYNRGTSEASFGYFPTPNKITGNHVANQSFRTISLPHVSTMGNASSFNLLNQPSSPSQLQQPSSSSSSSSSNMKQNGMLSRGNSSVNEIFTGNASSRRLVNDITTVYDTDAEAFDAEFTNLSKRQPFNSFDTLRYSPDDVKSGAAEAKSGVYTPYKSYREQLCVDEEKSVRADNRTFEPTSSSKITGKVLSNTVGPYENAASGSTGEILHNLNPNGRYTRGDSKKSLLVGTQSSASLTLKSTASFTSDGKATGMLGYSGSSLDREPVPGKEPQIYTQLDRNIRPTEGKKTQFSGLPLTAKQPEEIKLTGENQNNSSFFGNLLRHVGSSSSIATAAIAETAKKLADAALYPAEARDQYGYSRVPSSLNIHASSPSTSPISKSSISHGAIKNLGGFNGLSIKTSNADLDEYGIPFIHTNYSPTASDLNSSFRLPSISPPKNETDPTLLAALAHVEASQTFISQEKALQRLRSIREMRDSSISPTSSNTHNMPLRKATGLESPVLTEEARNLNSAYPSTAKMSARTQEIYSPIASALLNGVELSPEALEKAKNTSPMFLKKKTAQVNEICLFWERN